jgi:hypothetical protein
MPKETFIGGRPENSNSPFPWIGVASTDQSAGIRKRIYCTFPLGTNTRDILWEQASYEWHSIEMDEGRKSAS